MPQRGEFMRVIVEKRSGLSYEEFNDLLIAKINNVDTLAKTKSVFSSLIKDQVERIYLGEEAGDQIPVTIQLKGSLQKKGGVLEKEGILHLPRELKFKVRKEGVSFYSEPHTPYEDVSGYIWKHRYIWQEFSQTELFDGRKVFTLEGKWWRGPFYPQCGGSPILTALSIDRIQALGR
jgi:hypothetical protein